MEFFRSVSKQQIRNNVDRNFLQLTKKNNILLPSEGISQTPSSHNEAAHSICIFRKERPLEKTSLQYMKRKPKSKSYFGIRKADDSF